MEKVSLAGKQLAFCQGCLSCQETRHCILHDDAEAITAEMKASDVIVFASPVYYYGLTGQLKTLLDRANPLFASDYKFRDIYFLASAAEEGAKTPSRSITSLEGWIECFPKAHLTGTVFAGGVTRVGDIKGHPALKKPMTWDVPLENKGVGRGCEMICSFFTAFWKNGKRWHMGFLKKYRKHVGIVSQSRYDFLLC